MVTVPHVSKPVRMTVAQAVALADQILHDVPAAMASDRLREYLAGDERDCHLPAVEHDDTSGDMRHSPAGRRATTASLAREVPGYTPESFVSYAMGLTVVPLANDRCEIAGGAQ